MRAPARSMRQEGLDSSLPHAIDSCAARASRPCEGSSASRPSRRVDRFPGTASRCVAPGRGRKGALHGRDVPIYRDVNQAARYIQRMPGRPQRLARRENLKALLAPRHIAFVGGRQMERSIAMCRSAGFAGDVWTVNPRHESLAGIPCVGRVDELPRAPDAAFIALAAERSIGLVSELARIGARSAVVHATGFGERGAAFRRLEDRLVEAAGDMAIVGPNSMGVINNFDGVAIWPDLNDLEAVRGPGVAIISQSGAILFGITNTERAYPMGYALSIGNQAVVDAADAIDTVLDDERVRVVGLYLEGLSDGVALGEALARANRQDVPVVLLRGGGTPAAAERALSHTGKLAVPNDFWQALIDRYALVSVRSPKQLVETTKLLAVAGVPAGPRVFVTTYSGAACTLVAEQAPERGLELPPVPPANLERVRAVELRRALARRREHSRLRRAIPQCVLGGRSPHLRWPHQPPVPAGRRDHGGSGTRLLPRDRRGRGGRGVDDVSSRRVERCDLRAPTPWARSTLAPQKRAIGKAACASTTVARSPASERFRVVARSQAARLANRAQSRPGGHALLGRQGAPGLKGTAGRWIEGAWRIALDHKGPAFGGRDGARRGRDQRARVGVFRRGEKGVGRTALYRTPEIHHEDPVADMPDDAEIVRNEEIGEISLLLQILKQVDYLRLDRHVER